MTNYFSYFLPSFIAIILSILSFILHPNMTAGVLFMGPEFIVQHQTFCFLFLCLRQSVPNQPPELNEEHFTCPNVLVLSLYNLILQIQPQPSLDPSSSLSTWLVWAGPEVLAHAPNREKLRCIGSNRIERSHCEGFIVFFLFIFYYYFFHP